MKSSSHTHSHLFLAKGSDCKSYQTRPLKSQRYLSNALLAGGLLLCILLLSPSSFAGGNAYKAYQRDYSPMLAAPKFQSEADVDSKSDGCMSCHLESDSKSMHASDGVKLGCTDCHGGDANIRLTPGLSLDNRADDTFIELMASYRYN